MFGVALTQVLEMVAMLKRDQKIPPFKEGRGCVCVWGGGYRELYPDLKGGVQTYDFQFGTPSLR